MSHARGAPFHPQTQGKIERWHQTLNRVSNEDDSPVRDIADAMAKHLFGD